MDTIHLLAVCVCVCLYNLPPTESAPFPIHCYVVVVVLVGYVDAPLLYLPSPIFPFSLDCFLYPKLTHTKKHTNTHKYTHKQFSLSFFYSLVCPSLLA